MPCFHIQASVIGNCLRCIAIVVLVIVALPPQFLQHGASKLSSGPTFVEGFAFAPILPLCRHTSHDRHLYQTSVVHPSCVVISTELFDRHHYCQDRQQGIKPHLSPLRMLMQSSHSPQEDDRTSIGMAVTRNMTLDDDGDDTVMPEILTGSNNSSIMVAPTKEASLDWKVCYENAVVQMSAIQQQVNVQILSLLDQIEALQLRLQSMANEIQNKKFQIEHAKNETVLWQGLYTTMREKHVEEIQTLQDHYDTYVQNQIHEQVRNQIQFQRLQQQLQEQSTDYQNEVEELRTQYHEDKQALMNQHQAQVQLILTNGTRQEQRLQEQSQNQLSDQLAKREQYYNTTVIQPLQQQLHDVQSEFNATQLALSCSRHQTVTLQKNQQSIRYLMLQVLEICRERTSSFIVTRRRVGMPNLKIMKWLRVPPRRQRQRQRRSKSMSEIGDNKNDP
jgi:hypothetical protein